MVEKITYLKVEEFNHQGEFNHHGSECRINSLVFRKGNTMGHHEIKQVLDICNKYQNFDTHTLIIRGEKELTVWIEDKAQRPVTQAATDISASQSFSTKTVTRRYRGQVYEETVVDYAALQQNNQENKPRRKYRGKYID
ncbi:MAG: hypothetical protein AAFQ80_00565 [Cyanobacteria bacterium J06621_8]